MLLVWKFEVMSRRLKVDKAKLNFSFDCVSSISEYYSNCRRSVGQAISDWNEGIVTGIELS
jgi:hypothetical protein